MILRHYASVPVELDRDRMYEQRECRIFGKPQGLWISVLGEDDWPAWCRREEFCPEDLDYVHSVTLSRSASVLLINGKMEIETFYEPFGLPNGGIDWPKFAKLYDGIIITPYVWECRLSVDWYYGWDCASGCIWNLDAIDSFQLLTDEELERPRDGTRVCLSPIVESASSE